MVNFSEKLVRIVSGIVFLMLLIAGWGNHWIWIFEIFPFMIFFSTKGVVMFENKLWWGTRLFWAIFFMLSIFLLLYRQIPDLDNIDKKILLTRAFIALCLGSWIGDFFAKYIYIRLRFFINRIGGQGFRADYRIIEKKEQEQQYMKSLMKKVKISFYYITLDVNGKEITFLTNKEIFESIHEKNFINIHIKKGFLGYYYGVGLKK